MRGHIAALRHLLTTDYLSLVMASATAKIVALALFVMAARHLSVSAFGTYQLIVASVALAGFLADLGIGSVAMRTLGRAGTSSALHVVAVLGLRATASSLGIVIITLFMLSPWAPPLLRVHHITVTLASLTLVTLSITNTATIHLQATRRLRVLAGLLLAQAAAQTIVGALVLMRGGGVDALLVATTAGGLLSAVVLWGVSGAPRAWRALTQAARHQWRPLLREASPLLLMMIITQLYTSVDTLMLGAVGGPISAARAVAYYSAGDRYLTIALTIVVGSLNTALLPAFSRLAHAALVPAVARVLRATAGGGVMAAACLAAYAPSIAGWAGSTYGHTAGWVLRIVIWVLPLSMIITVGYTALVVLHEQNRVTGIFLAAFILNIAGNLVGIPLGSYRACAVLAVFCDLLIAIQVLRTLHRVLPTCHPGALLVRPLLLGGALSGMVAIEARLGVPAWLGLSLGGVLAGMLLFPFLREWLATP